MYTCMCVCVCVCVCVRAVCDLLLCATTTRASLAPAQVIGMEEKQEREELILRVRSIM